jgi:hypothetical protein
VVEAQAAAESDAAEARAAEARAAEVKAAAKQAAAEEQAAAEAKAAEERATEERAAEERAAAARAAEEQAAEARAAEARAAEVKAAEEQAAAEAKAAEERAAEERAAEERVAAARAAEEQAAEARAAEAKAAEEQAAAEAKAAEERAAEERAAAARAAEARAAEAKAAEEQAAAEAKAAEERAAEERAAEERAAAAKAAVAQAAEAEANVPARVLARGAEPDPLSDLAEVPMDPLLALAETIYEAQTGAPRERKPEPPPAAAAPPASEPVTAQQAPQKPAVAAKAPVIPSMPAALADLASAIGVSAAPAVEAAPELVPVSAAPSRPPAPQQAASQGQQPLALLSAGGGAVGLLAAPSPEPTVPPEPKPEIPAGFSEGRPSDFPSAPSMLAAVSGLSVPETPPIVNALAAPPAPGAPVPQAVEPSVEHPPSGSWLNLAPLQNYKAATRHSLQPATLPSKIVAHDTGPRITLPGPTLPPELVSLQETGVVTALGDPAKAKKTGGGMPGWAVSFLVMMGLLISGVIVVFYFSPLAHSSADVKPAPENVEVPTAAPAASHSLADMIEVTGFRILVDFNKKSEIHYLVVNHSPNELNDMTVYVTLHAAGAKPGQPPLCRFSFRAPAMKAFEVKEMTASIEKLTKSVTLPDWQDLRAEVQVAP